MQYSRHLKIFISSTFNDMHDEREILLKNTFLELKKIAKSRDVEITEIDLRTGVTKEQAESGQIVKICLDEIERCANSPIFFLGILANRYGWSEWLTTVDKSVLNDEKYAWIEKHQNVSITEIEIISALERDNRHNKALFYFKEHKEDDDKRLIELKNRLIDKSKTDNNLSIEKYKNGEEFREKTIHSFKKVLDELFPEDEKLSEVEKLRASHQIFAKSRQKIYIPYEENEAILSKFMDSEEDKLLLYGESGYGKSALIANYFEQFKKEKSHFVIEHYIGGAGELSNDLHQMLRRIMLEIKEEFKLDDELPTEPQKILDEFAIWLHRVGRPTIIVLDGYNQIEDELKEKLFYYLPEKFENVKLIITSIKDEYPLEYKQEIKALSENEQKELIEKYLKHYGKTLNSTTLQEIVSHPQTNNTLFLKTLLDEIRLLGVFEQLSDDIANYLTAKDVVELFSKIFERLERDYRPNLAKEVLSLLYVSRDGLSEDNLMEILNQNGTVARLEFSPLFLAIEEHLVDRGGLYGFFHGFILEAVKKRYLSSDELVNEYRRRIANYFEDREIDGQRMRELPFHLFKLKDKDKLYQNLVNFDFFFRLVDSDLDLEILQYLEFIDNKYNIAQEILAQTLLSENVYQLSRIALFLSVYYSKFDEALPLYKKSLEIQINLLGTNHYKTAQSYINLADFYKGISQYTQALPLYEKAINIIENKLGKSHFSTIEYKNSLGDFYILTGQYHKAIVLLNENIKFSIKYLGRENSETLFAYNNLALAYSSFDEHYKALEIYEDNYNISKLVYGELSLNVGRNYHNMSAAFFYLQDFTKAFKFLRKSLNIYKKLFGKRHPDTSQIHQNLGRINLEIQNIDTSIEEYKKAIEIQEQLFDSPHILLILSYNGLGEAYRFKEDYKSALIFLKKALELSIQVHGDKHDYTGLCYNSVGLLYDSIQNYTLAINYYEKAISSYLSVLNSSHSNLLTVYWNLVNIYFEGIKDYMKSLYYLEKILKIKKETLSDNNVEIINLYNLIGICYFNLKNYNQAHEYYTKTLELSQEHKEIAQLYISASYNNLAKLYVVQKEFDRALPLYQKAIELSNSVDSRTLAKYYSNFATYYFEVNDYENAKKYYLKSVDILESELDSEHPNLVEARDSLEKVNQKLNQ